MAKLVAIVVVTAMVTLFAISATGARQREAPWTKWEYRTTSDRLGRSEYLNKATEEGWELVDVVAIPNTDNAYFYLKRPTRR